MYREKATYFDRQVEAPWAAAAYGADEATKLERLFRHTGPVEGLRILEPGCGTGRLTEVLSDAVGPKGKVLACDISPRMLDAARVRLGDRDNVAFFEGPLESLPFTPGTQDLALCHQVFPHFEDKHLALRHLARALKPGRRLIVFHFITFAEINDIHRKAGTTVERDVMPGTEEMERLFTEAGFAIEFIRDDPEGYFLSAHLKGPEKAFL